MKYSSSTNATRRLLTREVFIGKVGVGGSNPIRIQSMTTSNTRDVAATVEQIIRLADVGCEIVRVTVQGIREALACEVIKNRLLQKNYAIPIVADVHFYPPAAMQVVEFVDKVRINPGNFADKRAVFKKIIYTDSSYQAELARVEELFVPLVQKCKALGKVLRIGANHGSLSDRIMNRYGDTPQGMVESVFEFARICSRYDFHDIVFSMKASNPLVMIHAYRLLVASMLQQGWSYPLHLGVTEAGSGEDGRIKSAVGIGSLLLDGLGDTIRVSLTEDPWEEIAPCKQLVALAQSYCDVQEFTRNVTPISKREVSLTPPLHRDGSVFVRIDQWQDLAMLKNCSPAPDGVVLSKSLTAIYPIESSLQNDFNIISDVATIDSDNELEWQQVLDKKPPFLLFAPREGLARIQLGRKFFEWMKKRGDKTPVILAFAYRGSMDQLVIDSAAEYGSLLADGLGEGILIDCHAPVEQRCTLAFNILQAVRMRTFKTDYISCPGCGRTLFQLQEVSRRIQEKTGHLPGVKIAIMGCVVNGPGEMADADFGYVGSKPGKVDLYIGKTCVEKDIAFEDADDRLIDLIKHSGRWIEPVKEV